MKIILLCGGLGVRFKSLYPKPLNLVHGKPLIYWTLKSIPYNDITIIYNYKLDEYNFTHTVQHLDPSKKFTFIKIKYDTRGPVETLFVGCKQINTDESILVLDNDISYDQSSLLQFKEGTNGILYQNRDNLNLTHYSFVECNENKIINIKERVPISNNICVGGYLFVNKSVALYYLEKTLNEIDIDKEVFMSLVFEKMIKDNLEIQAYPVKNDLIILGTIADCKLNAPKLQEQIRAVFDLDNTIVTLGQDKEYIKHIKDFMMFLQSQGHTIIISTARSMKSCNSNLGKVLKKSAVTVINWLELNNIPYDEIYFGKPEADIYIDDRAFNTYDKNLFKQLGFYDYNQTNYSETNQKTQLWIEEDKLFKCSHNFNGEKYYYSVAKKYQSLQYFLPNFLSDEESFICLEYLRGSSPLSHIYSNELLTVECFHQLLQTIDKFHALNIEDNTVISQKDIKQHYLEKFYNRAKKEDDYPFENFKEIFNNVDTFINDYVSQDICINNIIHGDMWFSNILLHKGSFKFIDMRGTVNNICTIKGDINYDYAKIYQSIIGLDSIIDYNQPVNFVQRQKIESIFWLYIKSKGIDPNTIKGLTQYMIFNTFHSYPKYWTKEKLQSIWSLITSIN